MEVYKPVNWIWVKRRHLHTADAVIYYIKLVLLGIILFRCNASLWKFR